MCEDTKLKAIHNSAILVSASCMLSSMCEDTKLKAIHNMTLGILARKKLSSMCEDTKLKAIHNDVLLSAAVACVVFNVRRY